MADAVQQSRARTLLKLRIFLLGFIVGLVLSGVTAFPLTWELNLLARLLGVSDTASPDQFTGLTGWIVTVRNALRDTDARYPFIAYGTDWLAFAHLVIAMAFIGPLRDPVRNRWVIDWGILCCLAVIPLALIAGPVRGIPFGWRLIDCSFGILGLWPLLLCRRWSKQLESVVPFPTTS